MLTIAVIPILIETAMQTAIPCLLMRGGTSKGPFFRATDLPSDLPTRDRVLLAAMGSPDKRQIDGVGGAHPLTSKVGIVSLSDKEGIDLEDRKSTRLNSSHLVISYAVFCLKKKKII